MAWWRAPDGSWLAGRPCPSPGPGTLHDPEGAEVSLRQAFHHLGDFALIRSFEPGVWSVHESMYWRGYAVRDGTLLEFWREEESLARWSYRVKPRLEGLEPWVGGGPDERLSSELAAREAARRAQWAKDREDAEERRGAAERRTD